MKYTPKKFLRRGQVLVLYALLMPLLFMFMCVGLDLGWYYLNVSRLQNAADAAVVAGAQALAEDFNSKAISTTTTSTSIETSGNTTTTTTTTTTITEKYGYKRLVDKYPENPSDKSKTAGDTVAEEYVIKNLGEETADKKIIDKWSKGGNPEVTPDYSLYEYDDKFYYVVKLTENIEHLFMPGWFKPMEAPVVAVALISKGNSSKTFIEELTELLEKAKNENVIIGNWQVQNHYRKINDNYTVTLKAGDVLIDENGQTVLDSSGNPVINQIEGRKVTIKRSTKFYMTFGSEVYTSAWNHFQDFYNRYTLGDLYRKQLVIVKDDVKYYENANGENYIDLEKTKGTIVSYGEGKYGESSSVAATAASINPDKTSTAYNPQHGSSKKTYQDGINETDTVGFPYTWKVVDSINIDFRPEINFGGKWLSEDWDLELDDYTDVTFNSNYKRWDSSGSEANKIGESKVKRMRIHTSMNFEDPYKVRPGAGTENEPDVLWGRIESEPMLYEPDTTDQSKNLGYLSSTVDKAPLNSVNQIILNFNQSNYNTNSQDYRPLIIFYDGPETNSIYSDYDTKNKFVRKSMPIIVNLKAPYRAILYVPNSPVVVIGEHKSDFKGFIMAKEYKQLKDDSDFYDSGEVRYFNNPQRQWEYTRKVKADGTVQYVDWGGTKVSSSVTKDEQAYRLRVYYAIDDPEPDPAKRTRYYKVYGKTDSDTSTANTYEIGVDGMKYIKIIEENGIDMYVDDRGDIAFKESSPPTDCGEYDTFGRTDFTTHDYHLNESSATNMLLSGK